MWQELCAQKWALEYWTGSCHNTLKDTSFHEMHEYLLSKGFKSAVFDQDDIEISLYSVAIASEEEWTSVPLQEDELER